MTSSSLDKNLCLSPHSTSIKKALCSDKLVCQQPPTPPVGGAQQASREQQGASSKQDPQRSTLTQTDVC